MGMEHDHILTEYGAEYASAQDVPVNTTAWGDEGAQENSGAMGGVAITAQANTDITMQPGRDLKIWVYQSTASSVGSVDPKVLGISITAATQYGAIWTASDTMKWNAGDILGRYIIPHDALHYTRIQLETNDLSALGKIDVFPEEIPR